MADYTTLMGAEKVESAGRAISGAADSMRSSASTMLDAAEQIRRTLDDFMIQFRETLDQHQLAMKEIANARSIKTDR